MSSVERNNLVYAFSCLAFEDETLEGGTGSKKPRKTRERILLSAFNEMYECGYQGMRIENILKSTGLAKGALYHHFESKKALGYAVVDEVIFAAFKSQLSVLQTADDPMARYCDIVESSSSLCTEQDVLRGCPLNNLAQEMSGLDEGFQQRLSVIFTYWRSTLARALQRGKMLGQIKANVNEDVVSLFIVSAIEGCIGTSKCMQSHEMFKELMITLRHYVESLRV